jgi:chromosomal replication initiator protein
VKSNIRELEGSLIKLLAYSSLTCQEISADMARALLRDFVREATPRKITIPAIQKAVAQHFDIPIESLRAKTRIARVVLARQVGIYLSRTMTETSLVETGKRFGGRDHSTVLHSFKKIAKALETDPVLKKKLDAIKEELES